MRWLRRLFGRDSETSSAPARDTDKAVLAGVVPLWQAPMIVDELAALGIKATFAESSSRRMIIGGPPSARIFVIERDQPAAQRFIAEITGVEG